MAIGASSNTKGWYDFQPESHDNREFDVEDPLVLSIKYLTPQEKQRYYVKLGLKRRRKVTEEEVSKVSKAIFIDTVKIKSGFLLDGKPCLDSEKLWEHMPSQELLTEIDQATGDLQFLIDGDPKNFTAKKK